MNPSDPNSANCSEPPALGPVLGFMQLLWEVDHAIQRTSKRMKTVLKVTGPQRLVIRIVGKFPGISAGRLADLLHVHPSTLTGVLKRLERQKLMHGRPDFRDRRRLLLRLTTKGRLLNVAKAGTVEAAVQRAINRTSASELSAARAVLVKIAESLDAGGNSRIKS